MKKIYQKPVWNKRERLSAVTAAPTSSLPPSEVSG